MGFSRQEYWSGLLFPTPGDLLNWGIKPGLPALHTDSLPTKLWGKPVLQQVNELINCGTSRQRSIVRVCTQLCPTLYDATDWSTLGSSVYGILQSRRLEGVLLSGKKTFGLSSEIWDSSNIELSSYQHELSSHEKTWRNLKCILQNERNQSERAMYCVITTMWHSGKGRPMETIKRSVIWGLGVEFSREQRIFRAVKAILYHIRMNRCLNMHLSKSIECTTSGVNL